MCTLQPLCVGKSFPHLGHAKDEADACSGKVAPSSGAPRQNDMWAQTAIFDEKGFAHTSHANITVKRGGFHERHGTPRGPTTADPASFVEAARD